MGIADQDRQWSKHAPAYEQQFLDPYRAGVINPLFEFLDRIPDPSAKTVADLGCGVGPLLPRLAERFGRVVAVDFAPAMLRRARRRCLGRSNVDYLERPMTDLDDQAGHWDVAVAVNSLVMPDPRHIDRALSQVRQALRPGGQFLGIVPAIDSIQYQTMLLLDQALDRGMPLDLARRTAAAQAEHPLYDFGFGLFRFEGLVQNFYHDFELRYRLQKAGFTAVRLCKVLYPWDDEFAQGRTFEDQPRPWDWFFTAKRRGTNRQAAKTQRKT